MIRDGVHRVSSGFFMTELLSSGDADVLQWIDEHLPTIGFINRAHANAMQDGVINPGLKEVL